MSGKYLTPCPDCGQYKYDDDNCDKCEVRQEIAFRERLEKSKPTPLPWTVQHGEVNSSIFDAEGMHIATVFPHCNAKYILDCVNALAGVENPAAALAGLVDAVREAAKQFDKLRDEILYEPEMDSDTINHFLGIVDSFTIASDLHAALVAFEATDA